MKTDNIDLKRESHAIFKYLIPNDNDKKFKAIVNAVGLQYISPNSQYPLKVHPSDYYFDISNGRVLNEYQLIYITNGRGVFRSNHTPKEGVSVRSGSMVYAFMEQILYFSACTDLLLPYAMEYIKWLLLGLPFLIFACGINPSIRADGNPRYAMLSMMIGCGLNLILAPLFIFTFNMGLAGSAISTVVGQIVSACLVLAYLPQLKTFTFKKSNIYLFANSTFAVLKLGLSSLMLNFCQIVNVLIINHLLIFYGSLSNLGAEAVFAAMGAAQKVAFLSTNVTSGIGIGSQPIISFNRGALNFSRVRKCYFSAPKIALLFSAIVTLLTRMFPEQIMLIFGDDNQGFMTFGVAVLKIWMLTIMLSAFQDVSTSFFQSIGRPLLAMTIPLARRILLILPMSYFFPRHWGVISILWAGPIADFIVSMIILVLLRKSFREMDKENFIKNDFLVNAKISSPKNASENN